MKFFEMIWKAEFPTPTQYFTEMARWFDFCTIQRFTDLSVFIEHDAIVNEETMEINDHKQEDPDLFSSENESIPDSYDSEDSAIST